MTCSNSFILFTALRKINTDLHAGVFSQLNCKLSVDGCKPPFVDLHSLLNSVTLNFLEEVDPDMLSRSSCDVEAVLGKKDKS